MFIRQMKREKSRRKFLGDAAISLGGAALASNLNNDVRGQGAVASSKNQSSNAAGSFGFVMHGGAGTITRQNMTPELEASYQAKLKEALFTGYQILKDGRPGLDAIEAALRLLEDSPLFNAGKGAVLTSLGTVE
ncbi:MAG TPA: isoaspartyl peptidase/L-asparaginase, partial [Pyrinomonadaceae bacterium]|nr:isoaspartyl peptidase/L-asparaginase [Pyrinomonadaceae bacterium]